MKFKKKLKKEYKRTPPAGEKAFLLRVNQNEGLDHKEKENEPKSRIGKALKNDLGLTLGREETHSHLLNIPASLNAALDEFLAENFKGKGNKTKAIVATIKYLLRQEGKI